MEEFEKDGICMCGLGTLRLRCAAQESNIVYVTYENEVSITIMKQTDRQGGEGSK